MSISSYLRPRFSIRALLVVTTLFALFLAYYWNWIRQRHLERATFEQYRAEQGKLVGGNSGLARRVVLYGHPAAIAYADDSLPFMLRMFGESPQTYIQKQWEDEATWKAEYVRLRGIFPEAVIYLYSR